MRVRDATDADRPRVAAVHAAAVRSVVERTDEVNAEDEAFGARSDGPTSVPYDRRELTGWNHDRDPEDYAVGDPDRPLVVAVSGETVVGFGALDLPAGEVSAVYVHPDHAGRRVGSAILAHLEGRAIEAGVGRLDLLASLNAVPFYERAGYVPVAETVIERETDPDQPVVRMEKRLRVVDPDAWGRLPA